MNKEFALKFSREWVESWNSHDIDLILSHYTEDFEIESPLAKQRFPKSDGLIKGKEAVKEYWTWGLELNPDLEFEIIDVLCGVTTISIYYLSKSSNVNVVEMMTFNEDSKVIKATVNYS
ncbi:nuclear transport factor 2 family protein [Muricauda ruestringensis]|uniref:Nuclear transport factor 2 family protein n=1 Tax=Flagellimonas aurea TaxID=2915619 RepID=A0ABS3G9U5_9FLAO|nr:nuclear transport factor 2 family protein [Allomuricauda aurea]MBO0356053.1 nuclear transport factor 2 family protein [Allomuricauda aurea]